MSQAWGHVAWTFSSKFHMLSPGHCKVGPQCFGRWVLGYIKKKYNWNVKLYWVVLKSIQVLCNGLLVHMLNVLVNISIHPLLDLFFQYTIYLYLILFPILLMPQKCNVQICILLLRIVSWFKTMLLVFCWMVCFTSQIYCNCWKLLIQDNTIYRKVQCYMSTVKYLFIAWLYCSRKIIACENVNWPFANNRTTWRK